ncbi:MAG: hypothetical protein HQL98_00650 [Magnetococcales bacterium]|nr:hypothetical protein [Magnetococcales bacterium]
MQLMSHKQPLPVRPPPSMRHAIFDAEHRTADNENARRLWAAVLERAILDLQEQTTRAEAMEWVSSNRRGVGSFQWICQQLDMDPSSVKHALINMYATQTIPKRAALRSGVGQGVVLSNP